MRTPAGLLTHIHDQLADSSNQTGYGFQVMMYGQHLAPRHWQPAVETILRRSAA